MYDLAKRCFDVVAALSLLALISPVMIPIMIGLCLTGEGYIFYLQERVGYKNRRFKIFKFATMLLDSPNMKGGIFTSRNDPRLTPMGGFLRKTKINELPQLLNIVKGDMSFVGPRPVMPQSFAEYPEHVQNVIYNVQPGITGVGSIVFRDEEEIINAAKDRGEDIMDLYTNTIYRYKGELESWYQSKHSILLDLCILFCTGWVIFFPKSDLLFRLYPDIPRTEHEHLPI